MPSPQKRSMGHPAQGRPGVPGRPDSTTRRRRWYLGIQSKKEPAAVMTEVYKALEELKCEWKTLASYRVRCRWVPTGMRYAAPGLGAGLGAGAGAGMGGQGGAPMAMAATGAHPQYIKIGLQLYKVRVMFAGGVGRVLCFGLC